MGKTETPGQGLPTSRLISASHTQDDAPELFPFVMPEESCGWLIVYLLLSSCIHLTMSTVIVLLWPHCQSLPLEKLLVLPEVGAHVPPSHRLCLTMFTKVPPLRTPEHQEVISPQLWEDSATQAPEPS